MAEKEKTFDSYLTSVDDEQRAALEKLRATIAKTVPDAEEAISYGLPAFKLNGKPLVAIGATKNHCAFYPLSESIVAQFAVELSNFETSKGTIRFQADKPLPAKLVRKLVKSRIAENNAKTRKRRS